MYSTSTILSRLTRSRLIACTATWHPGRKATCLDLNSAVDVIQESRTGALVYHVPSMLEEPLELSAYGWSFTDLLDRLENTSDVAILANTSCARNADQAIESARVASGAFGMMRNLVQQDRPIIKLEVFDSTLSIDNESVLEATMKLMTEDGLTVLPIVSPDLKWIAECVEINVPLVRVLVGKIGSLSGITCDADLRQLSAFSPVPLFFEGGLATPAHVRTAFRLGAHGVLMNSAFHRAQRPGLLARQIRLAVDRFARNNHQETSSSRAIRTGIS